MNYRVTTAIMLAIGIGLATGAPAQQATSTTNETPRTFVAPAAAFDYERRDVMIPMRDGVKLHTVILVPKGAHPAGILMTRTPYDATALTSHAQSGNLDRKRVAKVKSVSVRVNNSD